VNSPNHNLPQSWVVIRLGELKPGRNESLDPRKTPKSLFEVYSVPAFPTGKYAVLRGSEIGSSKQKVESGTVLLCGINPRINRVWVVSDAEGSQQIASTEWIAFKATPGIVPGYLRYFLQRDAVRDYLASNASGVGGSLMRVKGRTCSEIEFPIAPFREQERIVAEIEKQFTRLGAAVAALERVQANLKRYRAAVLKAGCEGRIVPTEAELARHDGRPYEPASELLERILTERRTRWEATQLAKFKEARRELEEAKGKKKYREPAATEAQNLPQLPEGWNWATVEQVTLLVTKGTSPGWQGFDYVSSGVPFVRSQNVRWGHLDLSEIAFVEQRFNTAHSNSIIREGDVLLNLVGASVGRSAIATREVDGANTNQAVGIIRLVPIGIENKFLMFHLLSPAGQAHIQKTKADVARANFNLDDIRPTPIPLPPFGEQIRIVDDMERRLSIIHELEALTYYRDDFWATTSNKQLNFLQHVKSLVKIHGRVAIVVPDNVLFEGGAGETVRRKLLHECDVHTLLRLPTGIFYAQGVKANVLFFDRKPASETPWTKNLWIYDFRTNEHFTLKTNPLKREDLDDFVASYHADNRHTRKGAERFKSFPYEDLLKRDKVSLDIFWLKDESLEDSANLPDPDVIAAEIAEDLQAALDQFAQIAADLKR
jgi:restriction endonuclease S subunit